MNFGYSMSQSAQYLQGADVSHEYDYIHTVVFLRNCVNTKTGN